MAGERPLPSGWGSRYGGHIRMVVDRVRCAGVEQERVNQSRVTMEDPPTWALSVRRHRARGANQA